MEQASLATKLGQRIRRLREERGLSLAQLAHQSEPQLTRFHLSHIERGARLPSLKALCGLAERLEIEPFELLLLGEDNPPPLRVLIAEKVRQLPAARAGDLLKALERELTRSG